MSTIVALALSTVAFFAVKFVAVDFTSNNAVVFFASLIAAAMVFILVSILGSLVGGSKADDSTTLDIAEARGQASRMAFKWVVIICGLVAAAIYYFGFIM